MKPPVEAPTSSAVIPVGSIPNASSAAASLWPPRLTYGSGAVTSTVAARIDRVAGLEITSCPVAVADPHLAREHERLGTASRLDQPALDEQLIEPNPLRFRMGGRTHPPIVAQPASRGLIGSAGGPRACRATRRSTDGLRSLARLTVAFRGQGGLDELAVRFSRLSVAPTSAGPPAAPDQSRFATHGRAGRSRTAPDRDSRSGRISAR